MDSWEVFEIKKIQTMQNFYFWASFLLNLGILSILLIVLQRG